MDINVYLFIVIALMLLIIMYLLFVLRRVRTQLALIKDALEDIKGGNLNRRILAGENDMTKTICYDINKIAVNSQAQLIRQRQSEQAYKRLMTSLSHDVKTPLASLVGYLEAVENKIVIGEEKDEYIHVAHEKAHYMKSFVENLFEWVKLDSGEQIFHFEKFDLNELSRNIIADWIPVLESNHFEYEFVIPETEYFIHIDVNAYTRVLNNLFQNIIIHSAGDKMALHICEDIQQAKIIISDNGKGIAPDKLPHIFERMYQCDQSRSAKGNGLGLAIAKELISVHKGTITAELLILDEPTNGLDPIGIAEVRDFIKTLSIERGKTILISSHILSEIALLADDIGIIDHGVLLEENSMNELQKKNSKYILLQVSDIPKTSLVLERQFGVTEYSVQDEHTLRIYDTSLDMAAVNKALVVQDIAVISSQLCNDTLEDYFKKITGGEGIA